MGKSIVSLSLLLLGEAAHGQSPIGAHVPDFNAPMPHYFSGTNSRAMGNLYIRPAPGHPSPPQFEDAQLYVGGELVASWERNPLDVPEQHVTLAVMFDSSHFPANSNVHVRITGHDNVPDGVGGRFYDSDVDDPGNDAPARNKAILYEHPDIGIFPDSVPIADMAMQGKNYTISAVNGGEWTEEEYTSALNGSNAVFYAGHGNANDHQPGAGGAITWMDYEISRIQHIGSGIPPFNSGAIPVNFLYLLACNCGDTNSFVRCAYPYYMAWGGPWMENQCWLGYRVYVPLSQYEKHADLIWPVLAGGSTVLTTRDEFNEFLIAKPGELFCWDEYPGPTRAMVEGDLALYASYEEDDLGDGGATRLRSVYTGTHAPPSTWVRQL